MSKEINQTNQEIKSYYSANANKEDFNYRTINEPYKAYYCKSIMDTVVKGENMYKLSINDQINNDDFKAIIDLMNIKFTEELFNQLPSSAKRHFILDQSEIDTSFLPKEALSFLEFVKKAHGEQRRKYTGRPYWEHCVSVAKILIDNGINDLVVILAALGHDLLEDTRVTTKDLNDFFFEEWHINPSCEIFYLTDIFTSDQFPYLNRKERKQLEAKRLSTLTKNVHNIKVADLIDNTASIVKYDPEFAKTYILEKENLINHLTRADDKLLAKARLQISEARVNLGLD